MNVLSLFDGMSCGQIALERAGIDIDCYYASEIDKYAMAVTQYHYPDTIQLGDVQNWRNWEIDWGSIDMLIGGSPCQGFSNAGAGLNFDDPRSKLFFIYVDILAHIRQFNPGVIFLLENVKMKKVWEDIITDYMQVRPIMIDSALVSAQSRKRLYWTNIKGVGQPKDRGILLADIIEDGIADRQKSYCIDANYYKGGNPKSYSVDNRRQLVFSHQSQKRAPLRVSNVNPSGKGMNGNVYSIFGKSPTLTTNKGEGPKIIGYDCNIKGHDYNRRIYSSVGKSPTLNTGSGGNLEPKVALDEKYYRKLTPIECERLQTIGDNWTFVPHPIYKNKMMSNSQRYHMLGNGWTVDVIVHILSHIGNGIKESRLPKQLSIFD